MHRHEPDKMKATDVRIARLRRAAKLCCHCVRNLAFNRARNRKLFHGPDSQFWLTVDGNFLDICILDWCKLFGDNKGKHGWQKVITNKDKFFEDMLKRIECNRNKFTDYIVDVKTYRDKFVSHLDEDNAMHIPSLDIIKDSSFYLYEYLLRNEQEGNCFHDAPAMSISEYYDRNFKQATIIYLAFLNNS